MSREIKFRYIWQNKDHILETEGIKTSVISLEDLENGDDLEWLAFKAINRLLARNQFTGLVDKAGKDIYESDVVSQNEGPNCIVEWNVNGHWHFRQVTNDAIYSINYWETEIIGNIYENPDLLQQTETEGEKT